MKTFIIQDYELKDEAFDISESDDETDKELQSKKSKKKIHFMPPFVNGFLIDGPLGDNILIATTENLIIFDKYYERQMTI